MNYIEHELVNGLKIALDLLTDIPVEDSLIMVEIPKDSSNGDYSSNLAMRLAKILKKNPFDIATTLQSILEKECPSVLKVEVARPGFLNFFIKPEKHADVINQIIKQQDNYGSNSIGQNDKVLVEYISANPTGILHLGHARGAAWGDSLTRILRKSGYDVLREYYINDAGAQIYNLCLSLYARYMELYDRQAEMPEDGYFGQDVVDIAKKIQEQVGDKYLHLSKEEALSEIESIGVQLELDRIKEDLEYYRVEMDSWISEKKLVSQHRIEHVVDRMNQMGLLYESEGALWFKSTDYGDDKDRVLRKSDGLYTYLTPDIANHVHKIERGYQKLINLWGADHHGYIARMKAALEALGYGKEVLEVDIIQMVRMVENNQEVKMSKRTGNAITIRELIDDIGVDAARYFFVSRALDTHFDFDLGLARSKSNDNPVFYAQYAYARICSIFKKGLDYQKTETYTHLTSEKEIELLKHLSQFTDVVADAAVSRQVNKICNYVNKLAQLFHSFYAVSQVINLEEPELTNERLGLSLATKITLRNALDLIGVSAPESM